MQIAEGRALAVEENRIDVALGPDRRTDRTPAAAKLAGYQFLDTDLVIMQRDGRLLREIYEERKDLYEKFADHIIDVDEQSIEATAQELAKIARED